MKKLGEIKRLLSEHKPSLTSQYPIESLAIFGSYARREHTTNSDVDILVEFNDDIGIRFIDLAYEIEGVLGTKIDLVSKNGIQKKYLRAINSDLIYV